MVRTLTSAAQTAAETTHGTEPITVVEVQWTDGGDMYAYADTRYADHIKGLIVEMSDIDAVIQVSENSDSAQVSVTLDDTSGALRDIINQNDVHQRPVWVYQHFAGLDEADRILLFRGKVSSPIVWNEGDRTLSFDVLTTIEDQEVGFSIEEGNFSNIAQEIAGKPWPLAFGKVRNVPALLVKTGVRGFVRNGFGIVDPTLLPRIEQTGLTCCPLVKTHESMVQGQGSGSNIFQTLALAKGQSQYGPEPNCECQNQATILGLQEDYLAQLAFQPDTISVVNGHLFPQGVEIYLRINDATLLGTFAGDVFTIAQRIHPSLNSLTIPPIKSFPCLAESEQPPDGYQQATCFITASSMEPTTISQESFNYLATFPTSSFFWAEAGTEVHYLEKSDIVYVANLLPSTVFTVKAYRNFTATGARRLARVPSTYYTVRTVDYGGYEVTEIVMDKLLSLRGEGWDDDIYVTMESTVGPNPVDVLEWVIGRYTEFTTDTTSFNAVRTAVDNMPTNFALLRRMQVSEFMREFAYQIRCAIYIRNNVVYLKQLASVGASVDTLEQSDVIANTLQMTHTATEDLVTKYIAEWTDDYSRDDPHTYTFSLHTAKYGVRPETFDYWAFTDHRLIRKSSVFWLIRRSQTWRLLEMDLSLAHVHLDVFDTISVNLPDFAPTTITGCLLEEARLDSNSRQIKVRLWTPVLAGTQVVADAAYLADVTESLNLGNLGPGDEAVPNTDVLPPEGTYLAGDLDVGRGTTVDATFEDYDPCADNYGIRGGMISEHCPEPDAPEPEDPEIDENPIGGGSSESPDAGPVNENPFNQGAADRGVQAGKDEALARDGSTPEGTNEAQEGYENLPTPEELEENDTCFVTVVIQWGIVSLVQKASGRGCTEDPSVSSIACNWSDAGQERFAYNSLAAAQLFVDSLETLGEPPIITTARVGGKYPAGAGIESLANWPASCAEPDIVEPIGYDSSDGGGGNMTGYDGSGF